MDDPALRQMKDFLLLFNSIGELCFQHCVVSFTEREATSNEIKCLDNCVSKYLGLNRKLMTTFVEVQPEIVKKRTEEIEKQQVAMMNANKENISTTSSAPIEQEVSSSS